MRQELLITGTSFGYQETHIATVVHSRWQNQILSRGSMRVHACKNYPGHHPAVATAFLLIPGSEPDGCK
jgi:hypothetical protein